MAVGDDDILDPTICNRVAHRHEEEPLTAVDPSSEDDAPESGSDTESLVSRDRSQGPTVGEVVEGTTFFRVQNIRSHPTRIRQFGCH